MTEKHYRRRRDLSSRRAQAGSGFAAAGSAVSPRAAPIQTPLVPKNDMHGFALTAVIAIMSFLAAWMLFAAYFIGESATAWSGAIAREAVVQIMPAPGQDSEKAQAEAANIAKSFSGIAEVRSVSAAETRRLLAPWLGPQADIAALPVPRLVVLRLQAGAKPDFDGLSAALQQNIKAVRFDSRQAWAGQLARGAHFMLGGALALLFLVLAALALTVIFAARGALAGNMHIVEVLHFIGADDRFIARHFNAHFFRAGLKGAFAGGAAAALLCMLLSFWAKAYRATPEGSQTAALFGDLTPGPGLYAAIFILILAVAVLSMAVSHWTLRRCLIKMDKKSSSFFTNMV